MTPGHINDASQTPRATMQVDYEVYADGEARLGWLNCTLRLTSRQAIDGNQLLRALATEIQSQLNRAGAEVAHLKMTLDADNKLGDLAVLNLIRNDFVPELSQNLQDRFEAGALTINMRAEASPEVLSNTVKDAIEKCAQPHAGLTVKLEHREFFRPGKPQPMYRVSAPS
jgi:hypothetical protein